MSHVKKLASSKYQARHRAQTGGSTRGTSDRKRDADYWLDEETRRIRRGSWTHPKAGPAHSRSGLPPTSATCT